MFEKVNKYHPDKIADRIAGALVDLAFKKSNQALPKVAVEVLIGHGECHIIGESSYEYEYPDVKAIVDRIAENTCLKVNCNIVKQDPILAENQSGVIKCGDNGIFKGSPVTSDEVLLTRIAKDITKLTNSDGKYILDRDLLTVCQSHIDEDMLLAIMGLLKKQWEKWWKNLEHKDDWFNYIEYALPEYTVINPLGYWTGGIDVDTGATNRKLGSDMGNSVTGSGLMGKDVSKADVSINIYLWHKAQEQQGHISASCSIGDTKVDINGNLIPYSEIVEFAQSYINRIGGYEKFAEWGLIR